MMDDAPNEGDPDDDQLHMLAHHAVNQLHRRTAAAAAAAAAAANKSDRINSDCLKSRHGNGHVHEDVDEDKDEDEDEDRDENENDHRDDDQYHHSQGVATGRRSRFQTRNYHRNHTNLYRTRPSDNFDEDDERDDDSDYDLDTPEDQTEYRPNGHNHNTPHVPNHADEYDDDDVYVDEDEDEDENDDDDDDNTPILLSTLNCIGRTARFQTVRTATLATRINCKHATDEDVNTPHTNDSEESDDNIPLIRRLPARSLQASSAIAATPSVTTAIDAPIKTAEPSDSDDDIPLAMKAILLRQRADVSVNANTSATASASASATASVNASVSVSANCGTHVAVRRTVRRTTRAGGGERKVRKARATSTRVRKTKSSKRRTRVEKEEAEEEDEQVTVKFEKPGQRRETPPENDPTRLFYQSMYHEKKSLGRNSDLAESWMLRHGLLDHDEAQRLASSTKRIMVS